MAERGTVVIIGGHGKIALLAAPSWQRPDSPSAP